MSSPPLKLILASQSPRRRRLLKEAGYSFDVVEPSQSAEEAATRHDDASDLVRHLALRKAADVAPRVQAGIVIGCDTVAECHGKILGKPRDREDAFEMLSLLRGRIHHVYSGLCLWRRPDDKTALEVAGTKLYMQEISESELDRYLESGAWAGKAGAFGYQDRLSWIEILEGSESNVVGLPMELLQKMLQPLESNSGSVEKESGGESAHGNGCPQ